MGATDKLANSKPSTGQLIRFNRREIKNFASKFNIQSHDSTIAVKIGNDALSNFTRLC